MFSKVITFLLLGFLGLAASANVVPPKFSSSSNGTVDSKGWISYKQCDSHWGSQALGSSITQTLCSNGSAVASVAMMLKTKGHDIDPSTLDAWLSQNNGYQNDSEMLWSAINVFLVTFQGIYKYSEKEICDELSYKHAVIAHIANDFSVDHWVLLTGCLGNGSGVFYLNDPTDSNGFANYCTLDDIVEVAVYY
jgi:hypothetical protein